MRLTFFHQRRPILLPFVKAALLLVPIVCLAILINDNVLFSSTTMYSYRPGHRIGPIGPQTPSQLIRTADAALRWRIGVDRFPINIKIPRLIDGVRVRLRLDSVTQPYVTFTSSSKRGSEQTTIVNAAVLNDLDWKHVTEDGVTLWMREKHAAEPSRASATAKTVSTPTAVSGRPVRAYDSISAFRTDPPDLSTVGLVGVERMTVTTVKNYLPTDVPISLGHTLRGSHQLYLYAANETIHIAFDKVDLNRSSGTDRVTVRLAKVDDLKTSSRRWLKTVTVGDDGISGKTGPRGKEQPVEVDVPNAAPGVYYVDIATSDDVLLKNFRTNQHHLSFVGRIFLADGPAYAEASFKAVKILTNGSRITIAANHEQGRQQVLVGGRKYVIQDVKVDHVFSNLGEQTTVDIPKGDIIIVGNGSLSLAGTTPLPYGANTIDVSVTSPDFPGLDYILADYVPHRTGPLTVEQTYSLSDLELQGKTLTFVLDAPGLQAASATLGLRDMRVTMISGDFPWRKVWTALGKKKK